MAPVLRSLRRVTSSGRFIPAIDGLRFVAITSVVLYHLNDYLLAKTSAFSPVDAKHDFLERILACGGSGVKLFFVISGFILGLPFAEHYLLARPKVSLRQYFARRVFRIEPPYIINLFIVFGLLVLAKSASIGSLLPNLGASLLYLHNLVFGEMSKINFVAWSLEVEVQFYIVAPLLALVFAIGRTVLRRSVLLAGIALLVAMKLAMPELFRAYLPVTILSFLDFFLAGLLLADVYAGTWRLRPTQCLRWDVLSLLAWSSAIAVQFHAFAEPFLPLVILVAYIATFRGRVSHGLLSSPWVATIGGMCYTIYLYHFLVISAVGRWTIGLSAGSMYWSNMLLQCILIVPPVLGVSAVLFLLFEKPFMVRDWPARCKAVLLSAVSRSRKQVPMPTDASGSPETSNV
jgi:peptidoglycan/LPS O-acetylase OafA/YrhL